MENIAFIAGIGSLMLALAAMLIINFRLSLKANELEIEISGWKGKYDAAREAVEAAREESAEWRAIAETYKSDLSLWEAGHEQESRYYDHLHRNGMHDRFDSSTGPMYGGAI